MKGPTKVWKFDEVYSIEVREDHELRLKVVIDWTCGASLYDRAVLDLNALIMEIQDKGWTISETDHVPASTGPGTSIARIVNQFTDRDEAETLAVDAISRLKEISELP